MILCIGLSPAVQRTLLFDGFALGQVNRARETLITASGKAVNVARVLLQLDGSPHLVQLIGGDSGRFVTASLDAMGLGHTSVRVHNDAPTRTCVTLLSDRDGPTEIVEEVRPVNSDDIHALRAAARPLIPHARALCLSGSFPEGVPAPFYADLIREANHLGVVTIVDAQNAPLKEALAARPFLVKPNLEEALGTLGLSRTDDAEADGVRAVTALREAGAEWALVSLGRTGSLLGGEDRFWKVESPKVEAVNAIGSGDSLTAGLVFAHIRRSKPIPEAVVFGTACAAANCLSLTSGVVNPEDVRRLLPQVKISEI
ncbi:MAG: 1-phosphofructokinase family hexose kinase [Cytophagales bacterium]|nr:1-phosphofructokinase family hexose kinase [Armatimonadota bacterium]